MLQILREKAKGIVVGLVVIAIAVSAVLSLSNYFTTGSSSRIAANVNGNKISWTDVETHALRMSKQYGDQVDKNTLSNQILSTLIQRHVLMDSATKLGFRVGTDQAEQLLVTIPAFQSQGKFSKEQYLQMLEQAGYSDSEFRKALQQDILVGQWEQGLAQSSFALLEEVKDAVALFDQARDFGYLILPAEHTLKNIQISSEQIKSYFDVHQSNFVKPEQVTLEYVELSLPKIAESIQPSSDEVLAYYQEHQAAFSTPERVHARHILIPANKSDPAEDAKAKQKISEILDQLKNGADFAEVAKAVSEDRGSAQKGGDLGWFVKGQMVPEFEQAAFSLKKADALSDPIRSQFGYHIIQLIARKDAEARPFAEVQNIAKEQLKREKAQILFAEKAEIFAKLAFEQPSSLQPIADQLGLKIEHTDPFSREGGKGIAENTEVVKVAFSDAVLKENHNSEPVKLSDMVTAIVRLKNHAPAQQQTLEQAEKEIRERLSLAQAKDMVKSVGESLVKEIQQGAKPEEVAKKHNLQWVSKTKVSRAATGNTDPNVVMLAFQIPNEKGLKVMGFVLPNQDYLIVNIDKITYGDWSKVEKDAQKAYIKSLADLYGQFEYALYGSQILQEAKVHYSKPNP